MPVRGKERTKERQRTLHEEMIPPGRGSIKKASSPQDHLFARVVRAWEAGLLDWPPDAYALGKMALSRREFALAREVFASLLEEPPPGLKRRQQREFIDDVKQCWLYADTMVLSNKSEPPAKTARKNNPSPEAYEYSPVIAGETSSAVPDEPPAPSRFQVEIPKLHVAFDTDAGPVIEAIRNSRRSDAKAFELALQAYRHSFRVSYDQLICLPTLRNIESLWYQQETARKVMRDFRGRAILADEVGLGKTIEAGLVLKEYMARGLVKSALVLAPSSLVNQWQEELRDKFELEFASSNDPLFRQDVEQFWAQPFIVASLHAARTDRHFNAVTSRAFDIIIIDEAHHLKNQTTKTWKLVNSVQKTFLLLLTATPVQNKLEEIYNLVTILRPGHLKTRTAFKDEFVTRGNPTDPRNRERLRLLLKEVMIRNTRSITQLRLPPRFAITTRVSQTESEKGFYEGVSGFVRECMMRRVRGINAMMCRRLLEAAGSSHHAAVRTLEKLNLNDHEDLRVFTEELAHLGKSIGQGSKTSKVLELLKASPDQKIVFANYIATLEHAHQVMTRHKIPHVVFQGSMTPAQKKAAIDEFRGGCPVLLSSGSGGEGHNLQFCHVMINYDLPWNPMEIEQRIGRIHRIGQTKEVQVYNFCSAGTVEDHILEVLDRKVNMFELVVGEIDTILGRLQDDKEFADMVFEIWTGHVDEQARNKEFEQLASRLKRARSAHEKTKELDEKLFREDFGI